MAFGSIGKWVQSTLDVVSGRKTNKAQMEMAQQIQDRLDKIGLPELQEYDLEELVSVGLVEPEELQVLTQENTALNNISLDPILRAAQMDALQQMQDIANNEGLTDADRYQLSQIQNAENANLRGQLGAIRQNAAMRGAGGSGIELMNAQMAAQNSATRQAEQDMAVKAQAQQKALEALMNSSNMASNINQQDYTQQLNKAKAQDIINQFNTSNQQSVMNQNVTNRNQAQAANLANQQDIANQNVAIRNQQAQQNNELAQQMFNNQMAKATGVNNAQQGMSNLMGQQSDRKSQAASSAMSGLAQAFASMYS